MGKGCGRTKGSSSVVAQLKEKGRWGTWGKEMKLYMENCCRDFNLREILLIIL